jgi:pyruvate dehydrogenase kinase 2/3/4
MHSPTSAIIKRLLTSPLTSVSLKQIAINNSIPLTQESLCNNARFLYHEVPRRLSRRFAEMDSEFPIRDSSNTIRSLLHCYSQSCIQLDELQEPIVSSWNSIEQFTSVIQNVKHELNSNIESMMQSLPPNTITTHQPILDKILSNIHLSIIGLRVLITQYKFNYDAFVEAKQNTTEAKPRPIVTNVPIGDIIKYMVQDTQALCVEKLGDSVDVSIVGDVNCRIMCIESHVQYCLMEILKNSMKAVLDRNQTLSSSSPPIEIRIAVQGHDVVIRVSDLGGGCSEQVRNNMFHFFYSTAQKMEPTYTYSGSFGAPFVGLGCGLPMARVYSNYMGGDIAIHSLPGYGTDAYISLKRHGNTGDIDALLN